MKVLIWIGCLFGITIVNQIIGELIHFRAGSILLYLIICFVAKKLCSRWDQHVKNKEYRYQQDTKKRSDKEERDATRGIGQDEWKCSCGQINKDYVSSCSCGQSKRMVLLVQNTASENTATITSTENSHTEDTNTPSAEIPICSAPTIKFCRKCGFELVAGSDFCSNCGTAIIKE